MGMALTRRQKDVLDFIVGFVEENGYSPSYEEIAHALDLASLATVHKHISALNEKKYLARGANQSRSVEVSSKYLQEHRRQKQKTALEVPLLGRIAAGLPLDAIENPATLSFSEFLGHSDTYALEVQGESMIEDHICDGDMVLIERGRDFRDGDIVVAVVAGGSDASLKRVYREPRNMVRLQPSNAGMKPMYYPMNDVEIRGKLLAVLRKFR
jgi:repressor LexA